jgi:ubiquinone/menaquinone biosynthesis C-methylase UbiE
VNEYFAANKRHWNECVPIHVRSEMYDVASFKAGGNKLKPVELAELSDVRGKTMLHLQCHFGLDSLSWARDQGAIVTGIDFSEPAIEAARALAADCGIDATFLVSELYTLPERLDGQFDIVFTSYGALAWLPDIERWAQIAAHFVKPGGTFYVVEFHPVAGIFDKPEGVTELIVRYPYFTTSEPLMFDDDGTYADRDAKLEHRLTYSWPHPVSDVVTALINAGLRIEFLHEFPCTTEQVFPFMEETPEHTFRLTKHDGSVPLMYSIKATKPT